MAKSKAKIGYKTKLGIWDGAAFGLVVEVTSLTPPSWSRDTVDVTHMDSPDNTKEFIGGMVEAGEAKITINYLPSVADAMLAAFMAETGRYRIIFAGGTVALEFDGVVTGYEIGDVTTGDKMSATITIKASGLPAYVSLGAPVNNLLPAVIGTAKVGTVLNAFAGEWVSADSLAYQWRADGVVIAGATARTYTPIAGNVGKALSVAVTATNAVGSTTAISGATSNTVA